MPPNFFTSSTGACLQCSVFERYIKERNMCEACPKNSWSEGGVSTRCKPCPRGMVTNPEGDVRLCVCEEGSQFKEDSGGSEFEKCPPGTANDSPGSTCTECTEGSVAPKLGMANCRGLSKGISATAQRSNTMYAVCQGFDQRTSKRLCGAGDELSAKT